MIPFIVPDWPAPATVHAYVTTRQGGESQAPYHSFNLAQHVGDDAAIVNANREKLKHYLPSEPVWLQQVHGTEVVPATASSQDCQADACYSETVNQVCAILTADCLPIFFCTRQGDKVALAHAGWRGLAAGVLENTLQCLAVAPEDILVWLGPCIGAQVFEVGPEVRAAFVDSLPKAATAFSPSGRPEHWLADLPQLARLRLAEQGVMQVSGGQYCTYQDAERFYSYRREAQTGRMASLIWLSETTTI